ncbi:MAG: metallophosphoesterase [Candidatus Aminicenantes bacterium]|nr:MAG: metallophosphoesterase [Candidatus Aminicenantes bacterium]
MDMIGNNGHYDIIGDVHGHAEILESLLKKLGYKNQHGCRRHPDRIAIFLGDLIDRGPENFRVLEIVKPMVDEGCALIIMGNHEYNALCYHTRDNDGRFLRPHNQKNIIQHKEVLEEIETRGQSQWHVYLEWFRKMPLFLEMEGSRIVHACWHQWSVDFIKKSNTRDNQGRLTDDFLIQSAQKGTGAFNAVEALLKGLEIMLPPGHAGVFDRDNNLRKELRLKWWMNPNEFKTLKTYGHAVRADYNAFERIVGLEIPGDILEQVKMIGETASTANTPVFFGHYWFTGKPRLLTETAACLDYSAARGGKLVCYRWDGEQTLTPTKFVF